jgi:glucokinase
MSTAARNGRSVVVGVDLGGTKIQAVAMREQERVGEARLPTPRTSPHDVVVAIAESITQLGVPQAEIRGVGIGSPGEIDQRLGAVRGARNLPGFEGSVELGRLVSEALGGVKVSLDNDVRSAIWGEYKLGSGRPYRNVLGVFVGTGVGGALVIGGRLHQGRGAAGEIGHMVYRPGGRRCNCGRRGCVEAYAGRAEMELRARKLVSKGRKTVLFDLMKKQRRDRMTSGIVAAALQAKDNLAEELIEDAVEALGIGIASAQNLVDADAIIIGGGLGDRLGGPFKDRIEETMRPHLFASDHPPAVLNTEFGDLAGAVGAAILAGALAG